MTLTFKKTANRYNAIGAFGTCYTIIEDTDGELALYCVEGKNTEFYTAQEAIDYCQAVEDTEDAVHHCYDMGVRAFTGGCCDETDIRYTAIDEIAYVYCPTVESAKAFVKFTGYCVDSYDLSHKTAEVNEDNAKRSIYKYDAHSDTFERISDDLCAIISQLIK